MAQGYTRKTLSKIRFNAATALKQFVYHLLPPILNNMAIASIEGRQAATNQQMGKLLSFDNTIRLFAWTAFVLALAGFALTPLECIVLVVLHFSRALTIAVKYGFRPQAEMLKFHHEKDPAKATSMLSKNLLSTWMNPERG